MNRLPSVRILLQAEGFILFATAVTAYAYLAGNGWMFAALLLVPDVSMLGYLRNSVWGSVIYNLAHLVLLPCVLLGLGLIGESPITAQIALIWLAHIGMDRTIGYGLKYPTGFKDTHLQRV